MAIHELAIVYPSAEIGRDVTIGPYAIVEANTVIGDGCLIEAHAIVREWTVLGKRCEVHPQAVLGGVPQDKKFKGEVSKLIIGDDNVVRESVSIHRATGEGAASVVGDENTFMAHSHIGHNCTVGSRTSISTYVGVAGFCEIEDDAVIGGQVGIHQYTRIGKLAMIAGHSAIRRDVPPFMMAEGEATQIIGINRVGLERHGVSAGSRGALRKAYKILFRSELNTSEALERVVADVPQTPEVQYLVEFVRRTSRGRAGRQRQQR
jgi:UDP-N-acetylglucosamine acyltransferase